MKYILAALSGMALTLCVFIGGAAFAIKYLSADPVPIQTPTVSSATVMQTEPVRVVDTSPEDIEPVESQPVPDPSPQDEAIEPAIGVEPTEPPLEFEPMPEVDEFTTASIADPQIPEPVSVPEPTNSLSDEHVIWCNDQYRSYRAEDNSYTPYSGGSRECTSPFSEEAAGDASDEDASYIEASAGGGDQEDTSTGKMSSEHVESCFSRYRSYRPEDNTYQPYGGGPRKQCE